MALIDSMTLEDLIAFEDTHSVTLGGGLSSGAPPSPASKKSAKSGGRLVKAKAKKSAWGFAMKKKSKRRAA